MKTFKPDTKTNPENEDYRVLSAKLGAPDTGRALSRLWDVSADRLSASDLKWFSGLTGYASNSLVDLAETTMGIGNLVINDTNNEGNFMGTDSLSTLLFNLSAQMHTLAGLIQIGEDAESMLNNPRVPD